MLKGGNAGAHCFRSLSIGKGRIVFATPRPWCREASTVIPRRPCKHSQRSWGNGQICSRSIGFTPLSNPSRTSSTFSKAKSKSNDASARRIAAAAFFTVIASGIFLDRSGIIDDHYSDAGSIFGGMKGPLVVRMTKRRDTSIHIRLGDSVLVDHIEPRSSTTIAGANDEEIVLLLPEDKETISPFLYLLMMQLKLVRVRNDDNHLHNLPIGMPGLGCIHCSPSTGKKTRSQIFPLNRRTFPSMVRRDLYNHIQRCEHCPPEVKLELRRLKKLEIGTKISREERVFFKKLWFRMGHKTTL